MDENDSIQPTPDSGYLQSDSQNGDTGFSQDNDVAVSHDRLIDTAQDNESRQADDSVKSEPDTKSGADDSVKLSADDTDGDTVRKDDTNMDYVTETRDASATDEVSASLEENSKSKKKSKTKVFKACDIFICNVKSLIDWLNLSVSRTTTNILNCYILQKKKKRRKRDETGEPESNLNVSLVFILFTYGYFFFFYYFLPLYKLGQNRITQAMLIGIVYCSHEHYRVSGSNVSIIFSFCINQNLCP